MCQRRIHTKHNNVGAERSKKVLEECKRRAVLEYGTAYDNLPDSIKNSIYLKIGILNVG